MKILLKDARILDPGSPFHKKRKNILIKNGIIASIGTKAPQADKVIESNNLHVSPGWFDMRANFNDPGFEHKEDLSVQIPNLEVFDKGNAQSFGKEIKERYQGMPLWKYALILALLFLLAEILLIRFL